MMNKSEKHINIIFENNKLFVIFAFLFIIVVYFLMNLFHPYISDDYDYSTCKNIKDIIDACVIDYFLWCSRFTAVLFIRVIMLFPKIFFNIINTIVFLINIILIFKISTISLKDNKKSSLFIGSLLVFIAFIFYFLMPRRNDVFLRLSACCTYLWNGTFILAYFFYFLKRLDNARNNSGIKFNICFNIIIFLISFLAGISSENNSLVVIIFSAFVIIYLLLKQKQRITDYIFCITSFIGYIILMVGPGNHVRAAQYDALLTFNPFKINFSVFFIRFASVSIRFFEQFYFHIIGIIILTTIYFILYNKQKKYKLSYYFIVYAMLGLLANYSLVFSALAPERSKYFVHIFLLLANIDLLINIFNFVDFTNVICCSWLAIVLFYCIPLSISLTNGFLYYNENIEILNYINSSVDYGIFEITIKNRKYHKLTR